MWNRTLCGRILAALLCALLLAACGGGSAVRGDGQKATARLSLALDVQTVGAQVSVELQATGADDLHQLACRVAYDPSALRFVEAQRGSLVDSRAVFFTTAKGAGYVPVAFTYHPGEKIPAASGGIARLTFEVLDPSSAASVSLVGVSDFLIARDALKKEIQVSLEGAAL